jgi:pimeloyl-ACP methyl ester carboxylesterase
VLWIPGWGDTPFSWFPLAVASTLQQGFEELVILDFPGFHGSLAHSRCITHLDRFFELTQDLVREFRPDALVGHSLGGWLAARAACDPLTAPSRLILMAPSGLCGGAAERAQWQKEFQSVVRSASAEEYGKKLFAKPPAGWGKVGSVFLPFLEREDTREFLDSVEARHFLDESTEALLSQMSVKQVHLLWGVSDQVVPERFSAHWLKHVPQAQLTRWQNVGHMPHVEKPLALLRWLRRNLSDLS